VLVQLLADALHLIQQNVGHGHAPLPLEKIGSMSTQGYGFERGTERASEARRRGEDVVGDEDHAAEREDSKALEELQTQQWHRGRHPKWLWTLSINS
jgi:hypothetical protein